MLISRQVGQLDHGEIVQVHPEEVQVAATAVVGAEDQSLAVGRTLEETLSKEIRTGQIVRKPSGRMGAGSGGC